MLGGQPVYKFLTNPKNYHNSDSTILDIISAIMCLPYEKDIKNYIDNHQGKVIVGDLVKVYQLSDFKIAQKAALSGDIRVLEAILKKEKVKKEIENFFFLLLLTNFIRGLPVLMLIEKYGYKIKKKDLNNALSHFTNLEKDQEWIIYLIKNLPKEELTEEILNKTIEKSKGVELMTQVAMRMTPIKIDLYVLSNYITLDQIKILEHLGFYVSSNVLSYFTDKENTDKFMYFIEKGDEPDKKVLNLALEKQNTILIDFIINNYEIRAGNYQLAKLVGKGNVDLVKKMYPIVKKYNSNKNTIYTFGEIAALNNDIEMFQLLSDLGENMGYLERNKALEGRSMTALKWLLENSDKHPEVLLFYNEAFEYVEEGSEVDGLLLQYIKTDNDEDW